jgi:autotransporter-associated beta strand protein
MKTKFFCMLSLLAACCWTAHGAVIDLNGVDLTVTEPNADGYVNTSQTAATLTLDLAGSVAYAGTISGNLSLIKAGAGTLTLSNACPYTGTTHVNGGVLEAPTDAYFGSGDGGAAVTLSNDARVRLTTTCTLLKRPFGVAEGATGHLEMPADVVVTTPVSNLFFKGAVLAKSGSGTLTIYAAGEIKFNANGSAAVAGGTLRVVEGSLAVTSPPRCVRQCVRSGEYDAGALFRHHARSRPSTHSAPPAQPVARSKDHNQATCARVQTI